MAYKFKNPNIEKAAKLPNETANSAFIKAVYQEQFGRPATQNEILHFQEKGASVKEVADTVLKEKSPFTNPLNKKTEEKKVAAGAGTGAGGGTGAGTGAGAGAGAGGGTKKAPDITAPAPAKSLFKDSAAYKALPQASKDFIDISYNLISFGSEEEATNFSNAIKAAKDIADPYFAAQMTIAQGDIELQIARANNDYEVQTEIAKRTRDDLKALLTNQKDYFDLQQTADMAKELDNYNNDLLTIASNAADKGLTFATGELSRQRVEDLRKTQYQDVVQSDTRLYNQRINELTMKAAQGDAEAAAKLAELNKGHTTSLEGIGRTAEQILGSGGLGNIAAQTGYTPVGGVPGSLEENKNTAILRDTNAFLDLQKGPNLQNNT